MTRAERLEEQAARAKEKLAEQRKALAQVEAQQRAETRKAVNKRRYLVGTLADAAGLLALDDTTLAGLFGLLETLTHLPNPVAVLEGLLVDVGSLPGRSVNGRAEAGPRVSPGC